ncbi:MAG TPA: signal peptide peptidase SppA, partial [Rhodospirillales bacterium]|nr:signal peptide peptidase SppA [Rhodospirillales bacterium]
MSLDADYIVDRRRLKRRLLFWRLFAVVSLTSVAVIVTLGFEQPQFSDYVARLNISGIIVDDPVRDQVLADLAENSRAKALVIRIDSPGGTVVGGEALYLSLRAVARNKPVVAVMGTTATSAAYMAAIAADQIIARQGSITGSIGVLMQTANFNGLLDKIGIVPETIKSGPLKAQPNPVEPMSAAARKAIQGVVMDMHGMFVDMVADRRGMVRSAALKLADGRIYTGRQALAAGLIDTLGGEGEARKWLASANKVSVDLPIHDVIVQRDRDNWQKLFLGWVGKTLFSERLRLDGL